MELGGDALTDTSGRITWIYRSRGPEDGPTIKKIAHARATGHPPA